MINDFINLTQGQLLIKYWWLWLAIIAMCILLESLRREK